ncbi:MAG: hypothetical protein AMXMBFR75_22210 [Candidatus Hinthialibacteria bacterium]
MNIPAEKKWAVIGGGMLGLTLALRLRRQGKKVVVFEAARDIGGLASTWQLGPLTWDRHYHVILLSDLSFRAVLADIGLEDEMEWVTTRTGVYAGGKVYSISNALEFLKFPPLGFIDKARLAFTILYGSRITNWKQLEKISVEDWLVRCSGRRTFEKFWLPLLRSKLGENYRKTSAAFIWTTIQRLYAARRTGLKTELFGYVKGGYARILEPFRKKLHEEGVEVITGCPLTRAEKHPGGINLVFADRPAEVFPKVVVTAAAPLAARLCTDLNADELSRLEGVLYQGILCASVLLDRPLGGFYVLNLLDGGLPFTGVIEMSTLVQPGHLGGYHLAYLPKYVPAEDPAFSLSDEEIEKQFKAGLFQIFPGLEEKNIQAFRVSRVRYVCPLSTLACSERVPPVVTSVPGLYLVNSAHILNGTLNVNETVQLADKAAAQFEAL